MSRVVIACCDQFLMTTTDGGQTVQNSVHLFNGSAYDMKYNGTIWLATGYSDPNNNGWNTFIATSTDGNSWITRTNHPFTNASYGTNIGWNGSYWLIRTNDNKIAKSTNGIDWSIIGNISSLNVTDLVFMWNGASWIGGVIVTGNTTSFIQSTDGSSWSALSTNVFSGGTVDIKYNGSYYLAAGNGSTLLAKSTDCINWTPISVSGVTTIYNIEWNGSYWLAACSNGILKSESTATNWSLNTSFVSSPTIAWDGVTWLGFYQQFYYNSSDGVSWIKKAGQIALGIVTIKGSILSAAPVSATAPGAPTGLTAVAGINSATLSWNAPASDGGSAITGYTLTTPVAAPVTVGNVLTTTLTGLISDGRPYTYTIQAINAVGVSAYSVEADTVYPLPPVTTPGAPTNVVALAGNGTVTVSWLAPASNGGATITSYIVVPSVGSSQDVGNALTATFSVANGTPVTFTVKAVNSAGSSPSSTASASVTPNPAATAPGAPRNVTVVAGANSATVSWAAPLSDGGSPVTGYVITPSIGSAVTVGNVLTATITGLASGTAITFTVTAINAIGGSPNPPTTTPVTPTPTITVPGAPRNLTVIAGANSAIVSWDAPLSNGGSPITGYTVTPSVGSPVTVGNVLTATLTGLAGGISVTFTVVAINSAGGSSNPPTTTPVTPTAPGAGPPSSVLGVTGIPGVGSAIISWSPPISNGGSPITGYKVICVPDNKRPNLAGPNDRSLEVRGLKNGMPVVFTVVALNAYGQSDSIVLTPNTLPSMPVVTAVRGGSGTINLIWKAKQNPTNPITSYLVTLVSPLPAPQSMVLPTPLVTATGGSVSISGLINGNSYVFLVQSVASIGRSVGGLSKAIIAASLPNPPTSFSGITAVSSAWLTWVAPTNTGGLPITGYTIIYSVFGVIKIVNVKLVTAVIIKGLTNGTAYSFTIQTNTSAGASTPTAPVIVTPSLTI